MLIELAGLLAQPYFTFPFCNSGFFWNGFFLFYKQTEAALQLRG